MMQSTKCEEPPCFAGEITACSIAGTLTASKPFYLAYLAKVEPLDVRSRNQATLVVGETRQSLSTTSRKQGSTTTRTARCSLRKLVGFTYQYYCPLSQQDPSQWSFLDAEERLRKPPLSTSYHLLAGILSQVLQVLVLRSVGSDRWMVGYCQAVVARRTSQSHLGGLQVSSAETLQDPP